MQKIQLKKGLNIPFDIKNIHNPAKYFGRCKLNWLILAFVSLTSLIIVSCSSKEIHAPNGNLEINRRNITDYSYSSLYDIIAFDFNQYEILEYYNSDSMLELSSQKPYTYIMHKYMDLCLDFLAQQDLIDANPFEINRRIHKKRAKLRKYFGIYKFICTFAENLLKNDTWTYLFHTYSDL